MEQIVDRDSAFHPEAKSDLSLNLNDFRHADASSAKKGCSAKVLTSLSVQSSSEYMYASIHHVQEIAEMIEEVGALLHFLPPYNHDNYTMPLNGSRIGRCL